MAKKRNNRNRGGYAAKTNKRPSAVGIIAAIAILLAVVYVITSLALGIKAGAPVWNPLKWGKAGATQEQPDGDNSDDKGDELTPGGYAAIDGNGRLMRSGIIYTMPESFVFIGDNSVTPAKTVARATAADTVISNGQSVTITATVTPENASDKRVTWSSDSRYVTVTPLSDGSNIATVTLTDYSPSVFFENKVTITCTSISNPTAVGSCTVSRLATKDEVNLRAIVNAPSLSYGDEVTVTAFAESNQGPSALCYGDIANIRTRIDPAQSDEFFNRVNYYLNSNKLNMYNYFSYERPGATISIVSPAEMFFDIPAPDPDYQKFNNAFMCACKDVYNGLTAKITLYIEVDYVFNGVNFGALSTTINEWISLDKLWVEVGDVEIGGDIVVTP